MHYTITMKTSLHTNPSSVSKPTAGAATTTSALKPVVTPAWRCSSCKTTDLALRYLSGSKTCKDCSRYKALVSNARKVRRDGHSFAVTMTQADFLTWCRSQPRECVYCKVADEDIYELDLSTQVGHRLQTLGIDRIDNERGYELDNIDFCCFPCNKVKSNIFTREEMLQIGPSVQAIWRARLAAGELDLAA